MKKLTIYDIEVAPNKAMVGFMDIKSGKVKQFQHDERKAIKKYVTGRKLIGFNNKNYDDIILTEMIDGASAKEIYRVSYDLIDGDGKRWDYSSYFKDSIDLMEVAPQSASLKLYGARLEAQKLQDLPYNPHEKHTKKMWKHVCDYNVNDLYLTLDLYTDLIPQLGLREGIGSDYGINVMSRSDAQVAEDVFKKALGFTKKPKIDKPELVTYKAPDYVKFKSKKLKKLKKKFESSVYHINKKTGKFLPQEWLEEKVMIDGMPYTIGYGGLHSNEKSLVVKKGLKNADIASMYPSLIINSGKYPIQLGAEWLTLYTKFRDDRMKIKHTDKIQSAMLKIFLNGTYGKLNSHYSILYAPHLMLDTTITGQLSLLMVIEALVDAGVKVVSANTDGVEYIDDGTNKAEKIIDKLGKKMNLLWEHASYKALYARDVNNYVAVYDDEVKSKGFYGKKTLEKNPQHPIVTHAIRQFLFDGTPMHKTIRKCKTVADFCVSRAVTGGALWSDVDYPDTEEYQKFIVEFEAGERKDNKALRKRNSEYKKTFVLAEAEENYIGKTVRWYYSEKGYPMFYKSSGNTVPLSDGCKPMMELKNKIPKDLDYGKYINLANEYLADTGWVA